MSNIPYVPPNPPVAFLHIPRTAGTLLTQTLAQQWRRVKIFATWQEFRDFPKAKLTSLDLIAGHFYAYQIEMPLFSRFTAITILRDPLERAMSSYAFARNEVERGNPNVDQNMEFAAKLDFFEWFHSYYGLTRHDQLNILGINSGEAPRLLSLSQRLARAKCRLDDMLVGTVEQIDNFAGLLEKTINAPKLTVQRTNTTDGSKDELKVTSSQLAAMKEVLALDYELYRYGRERFVKLCERFG